MQVEARINQDQNISKDLTLWNQQGSQVLRGQMLVLPIENTFLYVEPIYLQASQAKMPQLKKVALAMGNTLIYADTYQQALAQLSGRTQSAMEAASTLPAAAPTPDAGPRVALQARTPGSSRFGNTSGAIAILQRKASGARPAKNWKLCKPSWESEAHRGNAPKRYITVQ